MNMVASELIVLVYLTFAVKKRGQNIHQSVSQGLSVNVFQHFSIYGLWRFFPVILSAETYRSSTVKQNFLPYLYMRHKMKTTGNLNRLFGDMHMFDGIKLLQGNKTANRTFLKELSGKQRHQNISVVGRKCYGKLLRLRPYTYGILQVCTSHCGLNFPKEQIEICFYLTTHGHLTFGFKHIQTQLCFLLTNCTHIFFFSISSTSTASQVMSHHSFQLQFSKQNTFNTYKCTDIPPLSDWNFSNIVL